MAVPAFKTPEIGTHWGKLHPELRGLLRHLDDWLFDSGMERPTITETFRTDDEQQRIYTPHFLEQGYPLNEARRLARAKFTWHREYSAVDFRHSIKPYTEAERGKIWLRLRELCPQSKWELLEHDVGFGKHFHIARREKAPKPEAAV